MTQMKAALVLEAETARARDELRRVAQDIRGLGDRARDAGAAGAAGAGQISDGLVRTAAAADVAADSVRQVGGTGQIAAGQVGNLVAQFNDIGQMLMAGQNPLQLAVQQGTQISQVLGPMGAAGAVRALGAAFVGLFSPINLITIGGIAAGAALVQWLTSGTEKTLTLDEAMKGLEDQVAAYEKAAKSAAATTAEMRKQFGDGAEDARDLLREIAAMEGKQAARSLNTSFQTLDESLGVSLREEAARAQRSALGDSGWFEGLSQAQQEQARLRADLARSFSDMQQAMGIEDEGQRLAALVDAAQRVKTAYEDGAEAAGGLSSENEKTLDSINKMVAAAIRLKEVRDAEARAAAMRAAQPNAAYGRSRAEGEANSLESRRIADGLAEEGRISALIVQHGRDSLDVAVARVAAERDIFRAKLDALNLSETETRQRMQQWEAVKGIPALERERVATAQSMLAELQGQAAIQQAIATYGADSAEVARLRADQERAAFAAMVDTLVPAGDLRDRLMEAWQNAQGLGNTDMASGIAAARAEARAMADEIMRALGAAQALSAQGVSGLRESELRVKFAKDPVALAGALARDRMIAAQGVRRQGAEGGELAALDAEVNAYARNMEQIARNNEAQRAAIGRGGAGGGRGGGGRARGDSLSGLSDQARQLLTDLDIAAAGIAERVKAGMLSVAEGEEAMAQAKTRAANQLADLIARMERLGPVGKSAAEAARTALAELAVEAQRVDQSVRDGIIRSFEDSFARSLATGKSAMSAFADHVQMELARAFTRKFITPMITPLIDGIMGLFPFADGGVPDAPGLAEHRNTVVDQPTPFAMAGGKVGLMGEAGPEAILPLRRGPGGGLGVLATGADGRAGVLPLRRTPGGALGVEVPRWRSAAMDRIADRFARGGVIGPDGRSLPLMGETANGDPAPGGFTARSGDGAGNVQVNVINNAPNTRATANERQTGDGRVVDVLIEQIEGAIADRALRGVGAMGGVFARFGMQRQGQ